MVKERGSKGNQELRPRPKRGAGEELSALQAAMVAAEVKVADWLAQNELPLARSESVADDDGDSVKSDVPVQLKSLRGTEKTWSHTCKHTQACTCTHTHTYCIQTWDHNIYSQL